jgi:hypothetical protein
MINEYWILWLAIVASGYPILLLVKMVYSNQTFPLAALTGSFFFGGISLYLVKECGFEQQLISLLSLGGLSAIVIMFVLSGNGPFQGSIITTVTYAIVLFTVTGVSENCESATLTLFAFFGVGAHSLVALYSFVPKKDIDDQEPVERVSEIDTPRMLTQTDYQSRAPEVPAKIENFGSEIQLVEKSI